MPRTRKPIKVKEPIRLRTKELANGSKSLYLDIYRNGKRTYEYLKMYLIPETDRNARQQNETTMAAANAIKSKRIIELTSGEAGIMNHKDKVYLLDWMQLYKEEQKKRGKKNIGQIKSVTGILKEYAGERFTLNQIDLTFCHGYIDYMLTNYRPKGKPISASTRNTYYQIFNGALNAAVRAKRILKNHKGGVGKTTTTINLAAALRQKKKRVLAIDMDGQANLTESCGLSIEEEQTVYGAMRGEYPLPVIELENGLAVVPSCLDLSAAESELINEPGRELILKGLITKLLDSRKFDYILIDCPPSLGLLTLNALTTADFLIIPVQAQFLAMRGMAKITSVIEIVKERLNPNLSIGGIVITQFDKRKTLNKSVAEIINDSFCDKVFKTIVRDNVALAEAPIKGKNVFEYNKNCNGAKDYIALAQEVLKLK